MIGVDPGAGSELIGRVTVEARLVGGLSAGREGFTTSEVNWEDDSDGEAEIGFPVFANFFRNLNFSLNRFLIVACPAPSNRAYQR